MRTMNDYRKDRAAKDQKKAKVGEARKEVCRVVEWARERVKKCSNDNERAQLLNILLRLTEGVL